MFYYTPARGGAFRLYVTHNQGNKFNEFTGTFRGAWVSFADFTAQYATGSPIRNKKAATIVTAFNLFCGGYRTRTDHLKHAMLALYQMS